MRFSTTRFSNHLTKLIKITIEEYYWNLKPVDIHETMKYYRGKAVIAIRRDFNISDLTKATDMCFVKQRLLFSYSTKQSLLRWTLFRQGINLSSLFLFNLFFSNFHSRLRSISIYILTILGIPTAGRYALYCGIIAGSSAEPNIRYLLFTYEIYKNILAPAIEAYQTCSSVVLLLEHIDHRSSWSNCMQYVYVV